MYVIDMATVTTYVLWITLNKSGDVVEIGMLNNRTFEGYQLPDVSELPEFVAERIALLKLTEVNKTGKGESIGRKLSPFQLVVYLSYDEFNLLKRKSANEKVS
jgi:hypothetical protein